MAESTLYPQQSAFERVMGFIPLICIIFVFLQGWGDLAIVGFSIGMFSFVAWFWVYSVQKPLTTIQTTKLVLQPFGNDIKVLRMGVIFCLIEILLTFLLGADSLLRYQLMDNYGIFYIILIVTCYNFFWFWIPFTIWQDTKITIENQEKTNSNENKSPVLNKNLSRISKQTVKDQIKISLIIFMIFEICFLIDSLLWFYMKTGLIEVKLSTPGSILNNGPLIEVSAIMYVILLCQPIFTIYLLRIAHQEIFAQIKLPAQTKLDTKIENIQENERLENLKITRSLYFLNQKQSDI